MMKPKYYALLCFLIFSCFGKLYAQPANDTCATAELLTVGNGTCNSILYTNVAATTIGNPATPACWLPNTMSNTVWFKFVATTADIEVSTNFGGTLADTQLAIYSGTCGSLTLLACQEDINASAGLFHTDVILHGLTPGNTYYAIVDGKANTTGTFGICAQEALPLGPTLPLQDCVTSQNLCNLSSISVPDGPGGVGNDQENPSCFGAPGERSSNWYSFTAATNGNLCFTINPTSNIDYDFAVYNTTTSCPGTELSCNWSPTSPITGLGCVGVQCNTCLAVVAGQSYSILVDRFTALSTSGFTLDFAGTTTSFTAPAPTFTAPTVCVGTPTQFTNTTNGNFTYSWNFGDGFTSNLANPTHTYAAANTYNVTILVAAVPGGCQNSVTQTVTVVPPPTVNAGSGGTVCAGSCINLAGSTNAVGSTGPQSFTNSNSYAIPDASATGVLSPINVSGISPTAITASSIASVCLNLSHTFDGDLSIFLRCPDGTQIDLSSSNGGIGANYTSTCFTPTAVTPITSGTAPFTGNFLPEQAFTALNGCSANGNWQLFVQDNIGGDTGNILSWTITFNNNLPAFTWSPTTAMTNANTLTPTVCPTVTTTYTLTANNPGGCTTSDTVTVTVGSGATANINYSASAFCSSDTPKNVTLTGTGAYTGGTFSSTTGLTIDAAGTITPATSAAGTYTVTYAVPASGGCPAFNVTTSVTIRIQPNAGGDGSTTICNTNTTPINLFTLITGEQSGGIWTRTGGTGGTLNAATGVFTPAVGTTSSTFNYIVTGIVPCSNDSSMVTVTTVPQPNAGIDGGTSICDSSTASISLAALISGQQAGGVWTQSGGSGGTFNAAAATFTPAVGATTSTFTYTVNGVAPCVTDTSTATVTISPVLMPTINCGTSTTTSVQFNWAAVTGASGYTVSYQVNAGPIVSVGAIGNVLTYSVSGLSAGDSVSIIVIPTGAAGTCFSSATQVCTALNCTPPTANISYSAPSYCTTAAAQSVTLTGTGTFTGGSYTAGAGLTISATGTITPASSTPGNYTVSYTIAASAGCPPVIATASVTIVALPAAPVLTPTQPTCAIATGSVTITGIAGLTYSFDGSSYSSTLIYNGLAAGSSHTVTAQNASGCISAVANITLNAQPATPAAPTLTPTQPTCTVATGSVTITGVAGETYSFDGSAYTSTLIYNGLAAGSSHTVTAQNAAGCISAVANITLNAQPATPAAPTLTPTQPTCTVATGSVTITGVAGETYSFDGSAYSATLVYTGLAAGSSHTVTAQNASGCISAVANVTLNAQPGAPSAPTLTTTQPTCTIATGSATITGVAGETYSFDGSTYSATLVYGSLPAGSSHTVTAQNAAGCISAVANITLNAQPGAPSAPTLTPTQPTCTIATGSVTITGVTGETYSFDGSAYSSTLVYGSLLAGSSHTVTAQNAAGCISAVANITLNAQPGAPSAPTLTPTQPTCTIATGSVTITGVTGETYSFDGSAYSSTLVYSGLAAGSSHTVTSQNAAGCISAIANITLNAQPATPAAPTLTPTQPTCTVATGSITITGVAGETYSFDGSAYSATLVYGSLPAGSSHTVTAQNATGCISAIANITLNAQPATPAAPTLTSTQPNCTVATGSITITGVAGETYSFDGSAYSATLVYGSLPAGSSHTVTAQNAAGCISAVANITLNAQPGGPSAPTLTPTQPTCTIATGSITITGIAGETYSFDGSAYSATLVYGSLPAGSSHTVTAQNATGCISGAANITLNAQPGAPSAPTLTSTQPTCTVATGSITITGVAGETYSFDGSAYSATLVYGSLPAGSSHTVTAQNAAGCISAVANITLNAQPGAPSAPTLTPTQPTCTIATGSITITGIAGETYSFDGSAYSPTLVYGSLPAGSSHTVTAQNAAGCISAIANITLNAQPATPAAPTLTSTQPTCTVATGSVTVTGVAGETYSFDGSAYSSTLIYNGLAAGSSHTVMAQNAAGCVSAVANITLNAQPGAPSTPTLTPTQPTCTVATGSVTVTGVVGETYSFDGSAYSSTLVYTGLAAGSSHTVMAQNAAGCISAVASITLNAQPSAPSAPTLTTTQPTCTIATGSVTITGVAGETYSFDGSTYSATLIYGSLPAGSSHTVTAQNATGCISGAANITLNAQPGAPSAPTLTPTQPTCTIATGSITITGIAGETYSFDGSTYSATLIYGSLPAGSSHTVTAQNATGCISGAANITLNAQPGAPSAPTLTPTQPTCTIATGSITITGIAGETYSFDGSAYSATLVYGSLPAGSSHTVTAQNAAGCISGAANITLNAQPGAPSAPTLTTTQPTCSIATGSVTITGVAGETYSFDGSAYSSTLVYSGLAAGSSHTVTAQNATGCISAVANVTLNAQPATPAAPTLTATQPTCTVATGSITIIGIAGETYSFDGSAYSPTLIYNGLAAGSSHTITAQNAAGCISAVANITLNAQPGAPSAPTLTPTQPTCGVATGSVTITGVAGETYSFDGSAYSATLVYGSLPAGSSHTVTAQNGAGCISTVANITLNAQPGAPSAPILTPTQPTCTVATGSVTITGVAGETYSFDGSAYSATLVYGSLPAGSSHTVTAQNGAGCISTVANITLNAQPGAPSAPILTPTQPTCTVATGSVTITGVAGEIYSFDGSAYSATLVYGSLPAGSSHTVTAQNGAGCISTVANITLNAQPGAPSAPILTPTQPTCTVATGSVTVTGVAGETYSFDGSAYSSTLIYNGLAAGSSHTVTAQNAAGCISAVANITLNAQPATPAVPTLTPTQPTCTVATGSITITGAAGLTYSFDGSAYSSTLVYNGLAAGSSHTVMAQNAPGCISAIANITLNAQPATPSVPTLTPTQPTCTVATGSVTITGLTGLTYSFDGSAYSSTLVYNGLAAGSSHTVTALNATGCISSIANITLNAQPVTPIAIATPNSQVICSGNSSGIALTAIWGTTFNWTVIQNNVAGATAGSGNTISQTLTTTGNNAGQAIYTITPVANGCTGLPITVSITVNPLPVALANPSVQTICSGELTNIVLSSPSGGTSFSWTVTQTGVSGATTGSGNSISQVLTATGAVAGTVDYTIIPIQNGCNGAAIHVIITVNPRPQISNPVIYNLCDGDTANIILASTVSATGYSWTVSQSNVTGASSGTGSIINQPLTLTGTNVGTVIYTVTPTANGCVGIPTNLIVKVNPLPQPVIRNGTICVQQSSGTVTRTYVLDSGLSDSGYDFEWTLDSVVIAGATSNTYVASLPGTYSVIAINSQMGCVSQEVFAQVTTAFLGDGIVASVSGAFTENASIFINVPIGTGPFIYQLDHGPLQDSNVFTGVSGGLHTIYVTDANGCTNLQQEVTVIDYPKFFTPNGDGYNDYWNIFALSNQDHSRIFIYDRYGKLIKEISPKGIGWDGTYNGRELPATDYWFTVDYDESEVSKTFRSHFSLKR